MSIFDILKVGPGPSSSHTIGPMKAGRDFLSRLDGLDKSLLARAKALRIILLGSLSATGQGHGTDKAVLAGLMGYRPTDCPPRIMNEIALLAPSERLIKIDGLPGLPIGLDNVSFGPIQHGHPFSNTLIIELLATPYPTDEAIRPDQILFSKEYYSVGGGILQWKGWQAEEQGRPRYPYGNMAELKAALSGNNISLEQLVLENETAITGVSPSTVNEQLDQLLDLMLETVRRGGEAEGCLPGPLRLFRKAKHLKERANSLNDFEKILALINSYAYGAAEENAAGNLIVTAPTCGAAGVLPAVLTYLDQHLHIGREAQRAGLMAATVIGFIAKHNAAIAGAEVGCQGEIGVATAMAAAMIVKATGHSIQIVENAAEIALEHQLGLTCDPVCGYVQIPCIERNAIGAVKAINAALIARNENPSTHLVSYDAAVLAMNEIGREMSNKFKETSTGGLAVSMAEC